METVPIQTVLQQAQQQTNPIKTVPIQTIPIKTAPQQLPRKITKTEIAIMFNRNLCETKKEYTKILTNILTPFIYEGIASLYKYAREVNDIYIKESQYDVSVKNPGIMKIFQVCVKDLDSLNSTVIEREYNRIKEGCKCGLWFDNLVRAIFKSNIALLSFTGMHNISEIIKEEFHTKIDVKNFIHKCYIESGRNIYECPELFCHDLPNIELKRNQRETYCIIKRSIKDAIRKMLPMENILREYLQDNFDDLNFEETESEPEQKQPQLNRFIGGSHISESESSTSVNLLESDNSLYNKKSEQFGYSESSKSSKSDKFEKSISSNKLSESSQKAPEIKYQDQVNNAQENAPESIQEQKSEQKTEPKQEPEQKTKPGEIPRAESDTEFMKILKENKIDLNGMNKKRGRKPKSESKTYFEKFMNKP